MPRCVSYCIIDRDDGLFDVVATVAADKVYRRAGFTTLAAIEDWIDGLRILMAAIGAPLVRAELGLPARVAEGTAAESAGARLQRFRDAVSAAGPDDGGAGTSEARMRSEGGERLI